MKRWTNREGAACVSVATPAKLNLSLRVIGVRVDGYHLLDSLMVPVAVFDHVTITFQPAEDVAIDLVGHAGVTDAVEDNLAHRAACLFMKRTSRTGHVAIELRKEIPAGAGLGGGSSDAGAVLSGLDSIFGAGLETAQIAEWGLELGADVPFFLYRCPARVRGIGDRVEPISRLSWPPVVVAFDGEPLSTALVFSEYDRALTNATTPSIKPVFAELQEAPERWLANDLEAAASRIRPDIPRLKRKVLKMGARAALMTGSGAAVFGVWSDMEAARAAAQRLQSEGVWARAAEILNGRD